MKIICPALQIYDNYTVDLVYKIIKEIIYKDNPFLILENDEMTYIQACYNNNGFILEYQEGSMDKHYISENELTGEEIAEIFIEYSNDIDKWKQNIKFKIKKIKSGFINKTLYKIGLVIGMIIGKLLKIITDFIKGFKIGYNEAKKRKKQVNNTYTATAGA